MFEINRFFQAIIMQDAQALRSFFCADACVDWVCTNERFNVEEYICANCEYPSDWCGKIEKTAPLLDGLILAAKVWPQDETASFHVVSFIRLRDGKIAAMEEYWADDSPAPEWRQRMQIGKPIEKTGEHCK